MDMPLWLPCDEGVNIVLMDNNLDPMITVQIGSDSAVSVAVPSDEQSNSHVKPLFDLQGKDMISFRQIEEAMMNCLDSIRCKDDVMERLQRMEYILSDLSAIGWERVHKMSNNLIDVDLKIIDSDRRPHFMRLHYALSWPVQFTFDVDLPACLQINPKQRAPVAFEAFVNHVDACRDLWNQLKSIDTFACVIDPKQPRYSDVKRQIFLSEHVSMIVTLSPNEPRSLPDIQLIGPESQLKRYHDLMNLNLIHWDKFSGVLENLQKLFGGTLPELDSFSDVNYEDACTVSVGCLICQCSVGADGRVADLLCDCCHGAYHAACIRKWIRRHSQRVISFGFVMGPCPQCAKTIKVSARA
uniref:RING-type domain-containing protein n=1 Tax=Trichuris muris TaxID=70415 RepID=A0A5S6QH86_TRIMR